MIPDITMDMANPSMAPRVPSPSTTNPIMSTVLNIACNISMMLLRCIFSMPVKAAVAVFTNAPARMEKDAIWISCAIAGRLYSVVAKNPESASERIERDRPKAISKRNPETKRVRIFAALFSLLYWALYLIMAVFTPQSLKLAIRLGAANAIAYKPKDPGERSPARIIVPIEEKMVDTTKPQSR